MSRLLLIAALAAAIYFALVPELRTSDERAMPAPPGMSLATRGDHDALIEDAFVRHISGLQVAGQGRVVKVLRDDDSGSRHQRFIVQLDSGRTVLVAHNIDLAPRIDALRAGDTVAFFGEYEWNPKGGVVHWTHRDPQERQSAGWVKHAGQTYQ